MVRPIEITDSLSKAEAVQRLQQNQKVQPEAAHQFQKSLTEKSTKLVTTPNPVSQGDQVVLHVDEKEKEKRKTAEDNQDTSQNENGEMENDEENQKEKKTPQSSEHIDIKA